MQELLDLLESYNITEFEVTKEHYGNAMVDKQMKKLKILRIFERFIHDPFPFHRLGYGVVIMNFIDLRIIEVEVEASNG